MQPLTHRCAKLTWQTNLVSQFRFWIENPSEFTSFSILIIKLKSTSKVTQLAYHQPAAELPDTCPASMMMFNWQVPGVAPTASEVLFTFPRSYIDLFKKRGLLMGGENWAEHNWEEGGSLGARKKLNFVMNRTLYFWNLYFWWLSFGPANRRRDKVKLLLWNTAMFSENLKFNNSNTMISEKTVWIGNYILIVTSSSKVMLKQQSICIVK